MNMLNSLILLHFIKYNLYLLNVVLKTWCKRFFIEVAASLIKTVLIHSCTLFSGMIE